MNSQIIAKSIANRVSKGFSEIDSEQLLIDLLITCRDINSLMDSLVYHQFANDENDALLAVAA